MKSFIELGAELQDAFTKAEADKAAYEAIHAKAESDKAAAKAAYDAALSKSDTALKTASEKAAKSSAHLKSVQDDMSALIGSKFDPRVRQG